MEALCSVGRVEGRLWRGKGSKAGGSAAMVVAGARGAADSRFVFKLNLFRRNVFLLFKQDPKLTNAESMILCPNIPRNNNK